MTAPVRSPGTDARLEAQAKLNLFLRVLSREESGYHQLQTLFQRVDLSDTVTVRTHSTGRSLEVVGADTGPVEQNLAWRAAVAFADATGWPGSFAIEIEKRIPVGGGMGGGSADAGAVLRALNLLAPGPLADGALASMAFGLGADVPFLTSAFPLALATGRGERLLPFAPLPERDVLVVAPRFGVSSADAFGWYASAHAHDPAIARAALPLMGALDWPAVALLGGNDLEANVAKVHPEVAGAVEALRRSGACVAHMTGSGSAAFGVFDELPAARTLALPDSFKVLHTKTVDRVASVVVIA